MKKIRILHVVGKMDMGGTESLIMNVLRTYNRNLFEMEILVHSYDRAFFDEEIKSLGIKITRIKKFDGRNFHSYVHSLNEFFCQNNFDIVHGHLSSSASIYLYIAKKNGMKTVAHSHSVYEKSMYSALHKIFTYTTRYVSDYFCAPTFLAGKDRYGNKIVKGNRFFLVKNGFFTDNYLFREEVRNRIRIELNLNDKTSVFIHVGRFTKAKNHHKLLEVFSSYLNINRDAKLILVGSGELEKQIVSEIKDFSIENDVILLGIRKDISDILMAADIFIFPSINEGLGIALIEAQATGLKCIVSEKIPKEAIIDDSIVQVIPLSKDSSDWAKSAQSYLQKNTKRELSYGNIVNAGYRINSVVELLEEEYLRIIGGI